jgi:hypothetical protein
VVVHGEFGICDVVAVKDLGRSICIQSRTNNERHWVDAGKVELSRVAVGKVRLSSKAIGGVTGRVRLSKEARRAAYFPGRFPGRYEDDDDEHDDEHMYIQEREERKAALRAAKRKQYGLTEPPAKKDAQAAETGSATHVWG